MTAETSRARWVSAATVVATLAAGGCALPIYRQSRAPIAVGQPDFDTTVQVRFLGVAGWMIRRGDDVVMTAPLYTQPKFGALVGNRPLPIDDAKVAACHRFSDRADAILVGHAHYDHLMDVPPVWLKSGRPRVIGSQTTANILAGYAGTAPYQELPSHVSVLTEPTASEPGLVDSRQCFKDDDPSHWRAASCSSVTERAGEWFAGFGRGAVRVRGLCGRHPPQFLGLVHLWPGCVADPRTTAPVKGTDYREGPVLAYLIDFLDRPGGVPVFRVYYQDAPSDGAIGQVHEDLIRERDVDLALLSAGNSDVVNDAASIITNTRAHHVLVGHWEKFFGIVNEQKKLEPIPLFDVKWFLRRLEQKLGPSGNERTVLLPAPGVQVHYRVGTPPVLLETGPSEPLEWCRY